MKLMLPYLESIGRAADFVVDSYVDQLQGVARAVHIKDESRVPCIVNECDAYLVCIGGSHGRERYLISKMLENEYCLNPLNLSHQTSFVCSTSTIGRGTILMPRSVINSYSSIGESCIVNTNASIDHECVIGNGVHIMGGAVITGRVVINDYASIGSNATILPDIRIGKGAFVGAGAVVTKDVCDFQTVVGIPARNQ